MKIISLIVSTCCFLSAESAIATAQQNLLAPVVFSGKHDSNFGHFSHWSNVVMRDPTRIEIEYAVCNFDGSTPLIYRWNGPNIGVGDGGTLPVGKCHIVDRDVAAIEHDRSAFIEFTQAGRKHPAPAHLSKLQLPLPTNLLPRILVNRLRTFYGPESNAVEPSLANLVITQTRISDGVLRHTVVWYPPTVTVAIGADAFIGASVDTVSGMVKEQRGFSAQVSTLKALLADTNTRAVPEDQLAQPVVVITKTNESPPAQPVVLELKGIKTQSVSRSHLSVIDTDSKRLITNIEISTFGQ
jgi:hypothetical protein